MTIALLFLAGVLVGVMAGFPLGILLEQHQNKDYRPRLLAGKVVSFKQTDMVVTDITYQYGGALQ